MIPWLEMAGLLVLLLIAWFWFDSFQSRAAGLAAAQALCQAEAFQLLDETVALGQLRLVRDDDGRLRLLRRYDFEFSDTGDNRRVGWVTLIGTTLLTVHLPKRQCAACAGGSIANGRPPIGHRRLVE